MRAAPAALSLINAILGNADRPLIDEIEDLSCQDVILGPRQETRGCRLDVVARSKGRFVNVEVQLDPMRRMVDRMLFYMGQVLVRETNSGTRFEELPGVTVIALLDFDVRKENEDIHQPLSPCWEKPPQTRATDLVDMHIIELKKARRRLSALTEELKAGKKDPFLLWVYYLIEGYRHPEDPFVQEVLKVDEGLRSFAEQYHFNASDPAVQQKYFDYQMALWAERDRRETAMVQGIAIGRTEGIAIGEARGRAIGETRGRAIGEARGRAIGELTKARAIAKQALQLGLDAAVVAGFTGLPVAEVEALRKETP
jgi:predicted transposase/invertase (TIGR01784 family)